MLTVDFEVLDLGRGHSCLDVGCGEGRHTLSAYLQPDVMSLGIDLGLPDLQRARSRIGDMDEYHPRGKVAFMQGDATRLPFPDGFFDRVICSEVLEHVPNFIAVLGELNRVLKPGGRLCVSVPRAWPERICWWLSTGYHNTPGGHIRIFNAGFLRREITRLGLACYRQHGAHALHVPYWWLRCLFWQAGEKQPLVAAYHRLLVWDLLKKPAITQWLEKFCNPWLGKSVVLYFLKPEATAA